MKRWQAHTNSSHTSRAKREFEKHSKSKKMRGKQKPQNGQLEARKPTSSRVRKKKEKEKEKEKKEKKETKPSRSEESY